MLALFTYVGIGAGLAVLGLCVPSLGRSVAQAAARAGLGISYGRAVWFGGTTLAWPIGLYVLATGRLVLVDTDLPATTDGTAIETKTEHSLSTEGRKWISGDQSRS